MRVLIDSLLSLPRWMVLPLALILTGLIGVADHVTGHDLSLTAFYLIPIGWACWAAGRGAGLLLAFVSAAIWLLADLRSGYVYANQVIAYWNGLMLLVLFVGLVLLEAALQAAHKNLEETVRLRTISLHNELGENKRLAQAKLQAERLATVGMIAAQMAHEVRNPLGSITLNLDLINKEIDGLGKNSGRSTKEGRILVQEIQGEVYRVQHTIDDYLKFARAREPQRQPLALNALLEQKLTFMLAEFEQARVRLRTEFDPGLADVQADAGQIWAAILNLIKNSIEAMPDGGELFIRTQCDEGRALIRVADTGAGIKPEQLGQLFQPFFTTKRQGTGLGLALVQQIVSNHGGRVECDSLEGRGSTFTIYLPIGDQT